MAKPIKPGTPTPASGQYISGPKSTEITSVEGKPMPPTPPGSPGWTLKDPTKHKK